MRHPVAKVIRKEIDSVVLNCLTNDCLVSASKRLKNNFSQPSPLCRTRLAFDIRNKFNNQPLNGCCGLTPSGRRSDLARHAGSAAHTNR